MAESCSSFRTRQCAKCPWRKSTDPHTIPGGYSAAKHRALKSTIADPGSFRGPSSMMACHETPPGAEQACVGWVANHLGPGNNIALRLRFMRGDAPRFVLDGEQHERFEDTLPRRMARAGK